MKVEFEDEEEEEEDEDKSLIVRGTQTDQAPLLLTGRRRSEMIPPEEVSRQKRAPSSHTTCFVVGRARRSS